LAALGGIALMVLIGRDLWVRIKYGDDSEQYRELTHEPASMEHDRHADDAARAADSYIHGARWAAEHEPVSPDDCPKYSRMMFDGCQAWLREYAKQQDAKAVDGTR
jgi:hypothetical protein